MCSYHELAVRIRLWPVLRDSRHSPAISVASMLAVSNTFCEKSCVPPRSFGQHAAASKRKMSSFHLCPGIYGFLKSQRVQDNCYCRWAAQPCPPSFKYAESVLIAGSCESSMLFSPSPEDVHVGRWLYRASSLKASRDCTTRHHQRHVILLGRFVSHTSFNLHFSPRYPTSHTLFFFSHQQKISPRLAV